MKDWKEMLERYYEGDTTLEEETLLREYLATHPEASDTASAQLMADLAPFNAPQARKK